VNLFCRVLFVAIKSTLKSVKNGVQVDFSRGISSSDTSYCGRQRRAGMLVKKYQFAALRGAN
jgi:hypothetical protein